MLVAVLLECVSAVVVVAVISGITFAVGEPFGLPDVGNDPVSLLIKVICEEVDVKGLFRALKTCLNIVTIAQQYALELICIIDAKEALKLFLGLDRALSKYLFVLS